jgi:hypothetical protein
MKSQFYNSLLIILLAFLSIGAIYGGTALISNPDGAVFNMPVHLLQKSPFHDYLIPGIILLLIFGLFPLYVIYSLIKKPNNFWLHKLNLLSDHHYSWSFTIYTGFALIIWINVQTLIFNAVDLLHTIYSSLGIIIVCIALLPKTRSKFKL